MRFGLLTFWHRSFIFNSNKSPTRCNNFSVYCPDVCLQLNIFRAFSRPSSGAQLLRWQSLVLSSYRGDSRALFVVGPVGRPAVLHSQIGIPKMLRTMAEPLGEVSSVTRRLLRRRLGLQTSGHVNVFFSGHTSDTFLKTHVGMLLTQVVEAVDVWE
jgi:hypothetical protein